MLERKVQKSENNNNENQTTLLRRIVNEILFNAQKKGLSSYKEAFKFLFGDKYLFVVDILQQTSVKVPIIHEAGDTLNKLLLEAFKKNVLAENNDKGDSKAVDNANNDAPQISTVSLLQAVSRFLKVKLDIRSESTPYTIGESNLPELIVHLKDSPRRPADIKAQETSPNTSLSLSPSTHQTVKPPVRYLDILMPPEIYATITSFFSALSIARTSSVSKQWREISLLPSSKKQIIRDFTLLTKELYYSPVYLHNPHTLRMLANFKHSLPDNIQHTINSLYTTTLPSVNAQKNKLLKSISKLGSLATLTKDDTWNVNYLDALMISPLFLALILGKSQIVNELKGMGATILPDAINDIFTVNDYYILWLHFLVANSTNENDVQAIVHILEILAPYVNFRHYPKGVFTLAHELICRSIAHDLPTISIIQNILKEIKDTNTHHIPRYYLHNDYNGRKGSLVLAGLINFDKRKPGKYSSDIIDLYLSYFPLSNGLKKHLVYAARKSPNLLKPFLNPDKSKAENNNNTINNLNEHKEKNNPLLLHDAVHDAAKFNCSSSLVYLVKCGANLLNKDSLGNTALHHLANMNYLFNSNNSPEKTWELSYVDSFVKYLLDLNDIDAETIKKSGQNNLGQTLWHIAAQSHSYPIFMLQWDKSPADINARDKSGSTPLELALNHNLSEASDRMFLTISALLASQADIYLLGKDQKPLKDKLDHIFSEMLLKNILTSNELIPTILTNGRSTTIPLIHFAMTHALANTTSVALSHQYFNPKVHDESGRTPLVFACELAAKAKSNEVLVNTLEIIASSPHTQYLGKCNTSDILLVAGLTLAVLSQQTISTVTNPGDSKEAANNERNTLLIREFTNLYRKTSSVIDQRASTMQTPKLTRDGFEEIQKKIDDALKKILSSLPTVTPTLHNQNTLRLLITSFQNSIAQRIAAKTPSDTLFLGCANALLMFRSKLMMEAPNYTEVISDLTEIIMKLRHAIYLNNMDERQNTVGNRADHRPSQT